jgi:O-acetylhomoserine/O-acetylserine sulfhydrylase-like pyridoxal-dependent enzyme
MSDRLPGFNTLAIHAGAAPDAATGARATPIYQTTSFVFDDVDHAASLFGLQAFGNIYTRITNPTNAVLEERIAALEGGTAALAVASGHAAEFLTMHALMQPGDEFVASNKLYGGSINQFNHSYKNFGWSVAWADNDDPASFEAAITPRTKAIFCESIANPGGRHHRPRGALADRQEAQHPARRRQHHGDAVPDPTLRARRRHRGALGHQVPRRPRQLDRRPDRRRRHVPVGR